MTDSIGTRIAVSVFMVVSATGCSSESGRESSSSFPSQQLTSDARIHHFGNVSIESGAQLLSHDFTVSNNYNEPIEIVDVKRTCSCVASSVEKTTLQPGESTVLRLVVTVSKTGRLMQGATLIFSNGQIEYYSMTAVGTTTQKLRAFVTSPYVDPVQGHIGVRAYLVQEQDVERAPLAVLEPDDVAIKFDKWVTLERRSKATGRPTRQIANLALDFSHYDGGFPVSVKLKTEGGAVCSVTIHGATANKGETAIAR